MSTKRRAKPSPLHARLHPTLALWFANRFPSFTDIQQQALPHTLDGSNTLILAPTGSGKTLSAFLSVLSELRRRVDAAPLPNAVCVVYVSPLRSLDRDIHRNLTAPLAAINATLTERQQIRMEVRTGDTGLSDRGRQQRRRPHLLLTTVESLSALLSQAGWRDGFAPFCVVVDEIHAFAESKRGSLLALTLERLETRAPAALQRLGLSATAHPVEAVQQLLAGERPCAVAAVDRHRDYELRLALPSRNLAAAGFNPFPVAQTIADAVQQANTSLIFTSTRAATERLGLALQVLLPEYDERIAVHHGSVAREDRSRIEEGLADGTLKAVVCSTSLELGVDFPAVDQVVMVGAPRGVSRALQRLGRSGHRIGGISRGVLVPLNLIDLTECVALRNAMAEGRYDLLRVPRAPLDVLAQVLLGLAVEREWGIDEALALIRRAGPYATLSRESFDLVLDYLAGGGRVLGPYGTFGKVIIENNRFRVASRKVARNYYLNVGTISDDFQVKVLARGNRHLGSVEEGFLTGLRPGEGFVIGGKAVVLETLHQDTAMVRPATGERLQTPRWGGNKIPLTAELAKAELRLRRALRAAYESGGRDLAATVLREELHVEEPAVRQLLRLVERQQRAAPIPIDEPVQVERVREGRALSIQFHVLAGRAVNRSLGWALAYRLGMSGGQVESVVANFDDHSFLLSFDARKAPDDARLKEAFRPDNLHEDLQRVVESADALARSFRAVAETGQLLPRRTIRGRVGARTATWSGSLLYTTLRKYEPEHPLVREAVREVVEDQMDGERAIAEAARIHAAPWEVFDLPRPSPFALPLFVAFNRETLLAQDPERALDDYVAAIFDQWGGDEPTTEDNHDPAA